jgi:hypothetical protein
MMSTGDIPSISNVYTANTTYTPEMFAAVGGVGQGLGPAFGQPVRLAAVPTPEPASKLKKEKEDMASKRRLVQVIVIDPDENMPLEHCLLYRGDQKLTDATDQELFFELDIKELLAQHNEKRVTYHDKKIKERVQKLEPARVRDLRMVIVTAAEF